MLSYLTILTSLIYMCEERESDCSSSCTSKGGGRQEQWVQEGDEAAGERVHKTNGRSEELRQEGRRNGQTDGITRFCLHTYLVNMN